MFLALGLISFHIALHGKSYKQIVESSQTYGDMEIYNIYIYIYLYYIYVSIILSCKRIICFVIFTITVLCSFDQFKSVCCCALVFGLRGRRWKTRRWWCSFWWWRTISINNNHHSLLCWSSLCREIKFRYYIDLKEIILLDHFNNKVPGSTRQIQHAAFYTQRLLWGILM